MDPPLGHPGPVDDGGVGQGGVGDHHLRVLEGPDPGGPKGDVGDDALHFRGLDPVPGGKGLVRQDHQPAEQVAGGILGRQGEGQPRQPQAGDHPGDVVAGLADDDDPRQNHQHPLEDAGGEVHQGPVQLRMAAPESGHHRSGGVDQPPGHGDDDADPEKSPEQRQRPFQNREPPDQLPRRQIDPGADQQSTQRLLKAVGHLPRRRKPPETPVKNPGQKPDRWLPQQQKDQEIPQRQPHRDQMGQDLRKFFRRIHGRPSF